MKSSIFRDIRMCSPLKVNSGSAGYLVRAGLLLGLFFGLEDGGNIFLRNVG
jgi:hypothetical protein